MSWRGEFILICRCGKGQQSAAVAAQPGSR